MIVGYIENTIFNIGLFDYTIIIDKRFNEPFIIIIIIGIGIQSIVLQL